jgi:excinuclease UvrABC nuclease subunit
MRRIARQQRFEDAARLRDRIDALERVVRDLAELDRLRALEVCLVVPAAEDGFVRAYFVRGGRVAATRVLPRGAAGRLEAKAGLAVAGRSEPSLAPDDAEELLLLASFLRRPPPELRVVPLQAERILAA